MLIKNLLISLMVISAATSCQKKAEPIITTSKTLTTPIKCIQLSLSANNDPLAKELKQLYSFSDFCNYKLSLSYKKNISCSSPGSATMRTSGNFPISFLKLELRDELELKYTYYIDLYSNIDKADIKDAFLKLKTDLMTTK